MSDIHMPGWYDDGSGKQRWWDGQQWTDTVASPPPPLVVRRKFSGMAIAAIPLAVIALLLAPYPVPAFILWVVALGLTIGAWLQYKTIGHIALGFAAALTTLAGLFILGFATGVF